MAINFFFLPKKLIVIGKVGRISLHRGRDECPKKEMILKAPRLRLRGPEDSLGLVRFAYVRLGLVRFA